MMTAGRLAAKVALGIREAGGATRLNSHSSSQDLGGRIRGFSSHKRKSTFKQRAPSVGQRGPCQAWPPARRSESGFCRLFRFLPNAPQSAAPGCKDFLGLDLDDRVQLSADVFQGKWRQGRVLRTRLTPGFNSIEASDPRFCEGT